MRRRARGRAAPRAAALGCCVVAAALCGGGAPRARADGAYGVPRRDEARLHGAEVDPLGAVDTFERLSPAEQATWRAPTHADAALSSLLRDMSSLRTSSTVEVILVGFGGHHGGSAQLEAADVSTYLEAANLADSAHVLLGDAPDDTRLAARAAPHALPIETAFYFNVRKASDRFADMIERSLGDAYEGAAAAAEASGGRVPPGATLQLPHSAVDDIIAADHHESSLAYAVYVLNPKAMPRNYTYRYGQTGDGGCDGTLYASRERYAWIDLTAGPVHYGPAGVGEGVVLPDTLPRAARLPRAAVGAGAPRHAERLPVDVAALVLRTVRALVAPPMVRRQALVVETEVNLVHVMDHADPKRHAELKRAVASAVEELEPLLLNGQTLALTAVVTDLQRCDACSAAYAAALTSAAPAPGAAATAAAAHGPVTLDSKQLHWDMRAMRHSVLAAAIGERKVVATFGPSVADAERAPAGLDEHGGGGIKQRRVVPVYVFDMAHMTDSLLLDGGIAASAAADQVVASRSRSDPAVSQSECGGVAAVIDPNDLPRDILGALLEALYGVPRAGAGWSGSDSETRGGELRYDALWTVGHSPLGPLASGTMLPFSVADPAIRHVLHSAIDAHARVAHSELSRFAALGDEHATLSPADHDALVRRWNLLTHKLRKAATLASLHSFNSSAYYVRSSRHDLRAVHEMLGDAAAGLQTELVCYTEAHPPYGMLLAIALAGAALYSLLSSRGLKKLISRSGLMAGVRSRKFD